MSPKSVNPVLEPYLGLCRGHIRLVFGPNDFSQNCLRGPCGRGGGVKTIATVFCTPLKTARVFTKMWSVLWGWQWDIDQLHPCPELPSTHFGHKVVADLVASMLSSDHAGARPSASEISSLPWLQRFCLDDHAQFVVELSQAEDKKG